MDFNTMSNADLTAALAEHREKATPLFALTQPTIEQVNEAEALVASISAIEGEQATRASAVEDAAQRFASARATFAPVAENAISDDEDPEEEAQEEAKEDDEFSVAEDEGESDTTEAEADADAESESGADAVTTASPNHTTSQRVKASAARKVGAKAKRPSRIDAIPVTITASADIPNIAAGAVLDGMGAVARAGIARAKSFPSYNEAAAHAMADRSGGEPVIQKFGLASLNIDFDSALTASGTADDQYATVQHAIKDHREALVRSISAASMGQDPSLTAAGWCAPSERTYSYLASYVVDGLISLPEVSAPRGGLWITTGPALADTYADASTFGFQQTEAQAIANTAKTFQSIVCPAFTETRLRAVGYGWTIPFLTQKAYPELITDAMRLSQVLFAHKLNKQFILDIVAMASTVTPTQIGASFTDTLEALTVIATRERRRYNLGDNAVIEVKLPMWVEEAFRADMSRRNALALSDVATDQRINAEFAARNLHVEYLNDWQELGYNTTVAKFPTTFDALVYPSGAVVKAVEDVVSLQSVYDAASLTVNNYTGVFFEQGVATAQVGYGVRKFTITVNTAGLTGAQTLDYDPTSTNKYPTGV